MGALTKGPKMYIALATTDEENSKGSTRLHMDMADGVNIMVYSEARPDGSPGVAAWDLFRAEDADRLRRFLKRRFGVNGQHDPILSQQYYLDAALRKELFDDYGIKSHRVYQRPGDAVFIPAGCAHQVCSWGNNRMVVTPLRMFDF
jgi:[histone H3]-dimethyl-L-lysine9 demethylase